MSNRKYKWLAPPLPNKDKIGRWLLTRLAAILLLFSVILLGGGTLFKDRLIFHPVRESRLTPENYSMNYKERWLKTAAGDSVLAWRLERRPNSENTQTILFFQGNSGNMSIMLAHLATFQGLGFECFSVDYPGYGRSPGSPSEKAVYESAEALRQWTEELGIQAENTIIYGFSLGGGVASYLAAQKKPGALVLDSTFTRLRDVPAHDLPFLSPYLYLILGDAFDTKGRLLTDISCPLLVLHSRADDVVPYDLGQENFRIYRHKKEMVSGQGNHMSFLMNQKAYSEKLKELSDYLAEQGGQP